MEKKSNQFLGEECIGRLMRKYAIPCIISLLVGALYNIVDQIFIANADYLVSFLLQHGFFFFFGEEGKRTVAGAYKTVPFSRNTCYTLGRSGRIDRVLNDFRLRGHCFPIPSAKGAG